MHLKRLYKALAIVITVAMILPFAWVGADSNDGASSQTTPIASESQPPVDVANPEGEESLSQDDTDVVEESPSIGEETPSETEEIPPKESETPSDEEDDDEVTPIETPNDEDEPTESPEQPVTEEPVVTEKPIETPVTPTPATPTPAPTETHAPVNTPDPVAAATVPEEVREQTTGYGSNEALLNAQNIVMPTIEMDTLRFKKIDKVYGINIEDVQIKEEQNLDSRSVGTLTKEGLCYVIDETDSKDWLYVESGLVRGFVKTESILTGEDADTLVKEKGEGNMQLAQSLVDPLENLAFTYTKTTVRETVVEKIYAMSKEEDVNVREEKDTEGRVIGNLPKGAICYVIADQDQEWVYVEAENVRGFVRNDMLIIGETVQEQLEVSVGWTQEQEEDLSKKQMALTESKDQLNALKADKKQANEVIKQAKEQLKELEAILKKEQELAKEENEKVPNETLIEETTPVVDEVQDTATEEVEETPSPEESKEPTTVDLIAEAEDEIAALTSQAEALDTSIKEVESTIDTRSTEVTDAENDKKLKLMEAVKATPVVKEEIKPEENKAFYYTITSTKEVTVSGSIGEAMITFASQFLGNPYVWGGTSLTNGADCSGYVQAIYAHFGYSIPRTSREQAVFGTQIPISEARAGDLIFYANNGTVYHVVMYIGDGQVIHASSSKTGIITSGMDTEHAVWATRIISDEDYENIDTVNAKATASYGNASYTNAVQSDYGQTLGNFKLTAYCSCPICCGKWSGGPTASGTAPTEGRTVAMAGVPFGTQLIINGRVYTVEDRGTPYGHVDIFIDDHAAATQFGVQNAQVYAVK